MNIFLTVLSWLLLAMPIYGQKATDDLNKFYDSSFEIPSPQYAYKENKIDALPLYAFSQDGMISSYVQAAIDSTNNTMDIAIYGISDDNLSQAIIRARDRGVKVRMIINQSHLFNNKVDPSLQRLIDSKIDIRTLRGGGQYGIMHNKIAVFDSRILFCGSFNWTSKANSNNFENAIFSADTKYLDGYKKYFEWMWTYAKPYSQGPMPYYDVSILKFIPTDQSPSISFNSQTFPSYAFSPNGGIKDIVIKAINSSKKSIKISIFSFYDTQIKDALSKARERGVKVQIVGDRVQGSQSDVIKTLFNEGFDLKWSGGYNGGVMHNKFGIFDDRLLISGSFNYSISAEKYNFENIFVSNKNTYLNAFVEEFSLIYNTARKPTQEEIDSINVSGMNQSF